MSYLKLLGVIFQDSPTNWDKHFDDLMERALKRMHILRVCKRNGYSVSDLDYLFNCLIMSLFTYCIRVWGVAAYTKYLSQIDRLLRTAFRFGYIQHEKSIDLFTDTAAILNKFDLRSIIGCPGGHEHISFVFSSAFRDIFS